MAKQLSSAWKLMTPEQKKPYDEMAGRDKQRLVLVVDLGVVVDGYPVVSGA
jgi:hypothetical protein